MPGCKAWSIGLRNRKSHDDSDDDSDEVGLPERELGTGPVSQPDNRGLLKWKIKTLAQYPENTTNSN